MNYSDIVQFPRAHWSVDVDWNYLEHYIAIHQREMGLNLEPDFQRQHVWTESQQIAYVEYMLRGGEVARSLTFNARNWSHGDIFDYVIVDGKQRLEAVRKFWRGELRAFGKFKHEIGGHPRWFVAGFKWQVCELTTRAEVLQLYLNINAGGTPHSADEIAKVRRMLEDCR